MGTTRDLGYNRKPGTGFKSYTGANKCKINRSDDFTILFITESTIGDMLSLIMFSGTGRSIGEIITLPILMFNAKLKWRSYELEFLRDDGVFCVKFFVVKSNWEG